MYDKRSKLSKINEKICRIFKKIDTKQKGYISKYQIQFSFPREEREEKLKHKIVQCLTEMTSSSHYLDLYGFMQVVHVILANGLHHMNVY